MRRSLRRRLIASWLIAGTTPVVAVLIGIATLGRNAAAWVSNAPALVLAGVLLPAAAAGWNHCQTHRILVIFDRAEQVGLIENHDAPADRRGHRR
jgi:hypothetical protein